MKDLRADPAVQMWIDRLGPSGEDQYRTVERFLTEGLKNTEFAGAGLSKLVRFQETAMGRDRYRIGNLARNYFNRLQLSRKSKNTYLSRVLSAFLHNHVPLPRDPSFRFSNCTPTVAGDLPVEDLRAIILNSDPQFATIFLMLTQGLLDQKRLCHINTEHAALIVSAVRKRKGIIQIPLPGRKNNPRPYFTMLDTNDSDFAESFRHYMRTTTHPIHKVLFLNDRGNPITEGNIRRYFHRRTVERGLTEQFTPACPKCGGQTIRRILTYPKLDADGQKRKKRAYICRECGEKTFACDLGEAWMRKIAAHRTGKHPHEIRDLMSSRWAMSGADRVVREGVLGHGLDPNDYEKFKYQTGFAEREYRKALPYLNILSEDPEKISRSQVDAELEGTKRELELMRSELGKMRRERETTAARLRRIEQELEKL